jgi:hypothetical protein
MKFIAFYIEGACFLLIYDILRDKTAKNRNVEAVKIGLQCLKNMVPGGELITSNIISIQRLLDTIDSMPARTMNEPTSTGFASDNLDSTSALDKPTGLDFSLDTLVNFTAGWATFQDSRFLSQNTVPEPGYFNPDIFNINWEFDTFGPSSLALF